MCAGAGHLLDVVLDDVEVAVESGVIGQVLIAHSARGRGKGREGDPRCVDRAVGGGWVCQISLQQSPERHVNIMPNRQNRQGLKAVIQVLMYLFLRTKKMGDNNLMVSSNHNKQQHCFQHPVQTHAPNPCIFID